MAPERIAALVCQVPFGKIPRCPGPCSAIGPHHNDYALCPLSGSCHAGGWQKVLDDCPLEAAIHVVEWGQTNNRPTTYRLVFVWGLRSILCNFAGLVGFATNALVRCILDNNKLPGTPNWF